MRKKDEERLAALREAARARGRDVALLPSTRPEQVFAHARAKRIGLYHAAHRVKRASLLRAAFALVDLTIVPDEESERDAVRYGADPDRIERDDAEPLARLLREPKRRSLVGGAAEAAASALLDAAEATGAVALLERLTPDQGVNVVNYHRVLPLDELFTYTRPQMALSAPTFEAQLDTIAARRGFTPVEHLSDVAAGGRVAITFDDGYEDNFRIALPLLERFSAPACVFVVTNLIGREDALWWDRVGLGLFAWWKDGKPRPLPAGLPERAYRLAKIETFEEARTLISEVLSDLNLASSEARESAAEQAAALVASLRAPRTMLTWDEVRAMHRAGVTFGAHTRNHVPLDELDAGTAKEELFGSRADLEARIGPEPHATAALPRGRLGPLSEEELEAGGFRTVMTTDPGVNPTDGRLLIKRRDGRMLTLAGRHHPAKLRLELTGLVDRLRSAYYGLRR